MSTLHPPVGPKDHSQGPADAAATLVEYGDYQCPYCGEAYGVVKQIQERYGDRLRFVFRNFPIPELHPQALAAATTAEYCGDNGRFWQAHDALYENQQSLGEGLYEEIVRELGLDVAGLRAALEGNTYADRLQDDVDSGIRSGVNGTPAFYLNGSMVQISSFDDLPRAVADALG